MSTLPEEFGFSTHDLSANRKGYMTKRQRTRLSEGQSSTLRISLYMSVAIVGSLLVGLLAGGMALAVCGSFALLGGIVTLMEMLGGHDKYSQDLYSGQVESVQGRVRLQEDHLPAGTGTHYLVYVAERRFPLTRTQYSAFENGDIYTLYYAPETQALLSVEYIMPNIDAGDEDTIASFDRLMNTN